MNLSRKLFLIGFLAIATLVACNKDDEDDDDSVRCGPNWSPQEELQDEIDALTAAAQTYGMDPTTENCEAYRAALFDYLEEIRDWEDCFTKVGQRQQFQEDVEQLEEDIENIQC
ncbi:MAG: hypothetical protein R3275_07255 [Saprospiraceae bacterium]|nr:hypothetical protein [Saprospiraceae bacterium]